MAAVVIDPDDRRSCLALLLAAEAQRWGHAVDPVTGETGYLIPSQRYQGLYHAATAEQCSCRDFKLHGPCKHVRTVRLVELLELALGRLPSRRTA
jgi:hypothetical protein